MLVKIIKKKENLDQVLPFYIENLLWGTVSIPETRGYLGFVEGEGFYLKMICQESDPRREYYEDNDPVYQDSAVEAFLQFDDKHYINLEMNANGALLAAFGAGRENRRYFTSSELEKFECRAECREAEWEVSVSLPLSVIESAFGAAKLGRGSSFACNFYKISETAEIEHYGSYAPVRTPVPDFHRPEFFAAARIED